jgi:CYTH domain-containing protein
MGIEIERKFLVKQDLWRPEGPGTAFRQGYLATGGGRTVRVRVAGDQGFLTIKGPTTGLSRAEYEYAIPLEDAAAMLDTLCLRPFIATTPDWWWPSWS